MSGPKRMDIRMVVFDVDGTLTAHKSVWQYIHERLGLWEGNAERYQAAYRRGDIDYAEFCRLDAGLWRGIGESRLRELIAGIEYNPGVPRALGRLKETGLPLAAVSTGLSLLVDRVAADLDIDYTISNRLIADGGRITGEVELKVSDGRKGEAVARLAESSGIEPRAMAAVGDSETDIGIFRPAGFSVAYGNVPDSVAAAVDRLVPGGDFGRVADVILERIGAGH